MSLKGDHTVVFIHGSWLGGWCWEGVAPLFEKAGYRVACPTLSGSGERFEEATPDTSVTKHIEDVLETLKAEEISQPILVSHSYGAVVAHGVLDALNYDVRALVILDGFMPTPGLSIFEQRFDVRELMEQHRMPGRPWLLRPPVVEFLEIDNPELAERIHNRLTPFPALTHSSVVSFEPSRVAGLPKVFIRCERSPLFEEEEKLAVEQGWLVTRVDMGHFALLSHPDKVSDALLKAIHSLFSSNQLF